MLRVEDVAGKPIAHAVNFAAHPTMHPAEPDEVLGRLPRRDGEARGSRNRRAVPVPSGRGRRPVAEPAGRAWRPGRFGKRLGEDVLKLAEGREAGGGRGPNSSTRREEFAFKCLIDIKNVLIRGALERAFFPELIGFFEREYTDGVRPPLTVACWTARSGSSACRASSSASTP